MSKKKPFPWKIIDEIGEEGAEKRLLLVEPIGSRSEFDETSIVMVGCWPDLSDFPTLVAAGIETFEQLKRLHPVLNIGGEPWDDGLLWAVIMQSDRDYDNSCVEHSGRLDAYFSLDDLEKLASLGPQAVKRARQLWDNGSISDELDLGGFRKDKYDNAVKLRLAIEQAIKEFSPKE